MITDLVPSLSIENFLAQRDAMVERAREARRLLEEVQDIAQSLPPGSDTRSWFGRLRLNTEPNRYEFTDARGLDDYLKAIDAACWDRLLDLSGLRTFMDAAARKQWDENINDRKVPELTYENVKATFEVMHATRGDMFERGVVAVFRSLSWDFKTNNPVMFGKRIILRHVFDTRLGFYVHHESANRLDDIMRVFCLLDGKPEPDHRQGAYYRMSAAKFGTADFDGYFSTKGFKNGNGHLTFQRPDLVDKMNQIIAKHYPGALPPGREAA